MAGPAVQQRPAAQPRYGVTGSLDVDEHRRTLVEPPQYLDVRSVDRLRQGAVEPFERRHRLGVAASGDPPIELLHLPTLFANGVPRTAATRR
jgi:hypothetical protein